MIVGVVFSAIAALVILAYLAAKNRVFETKVERTLFDPRIHGAPTKPGVIYIMRCEAHGPNIYKIGFTTKPVEKRAKQLSASTASPLPFKVLKTFAVGEVDYAEKVVHQELGEFRIAKNREFFAAPYEEILRRINNRVERAIVKSFSE